jgi:hypothetical protein
MGCKCILGSVFRLTFGRFIAYQVEQLSHVTRGVKCGSRVHVLQGDVVIGRDSARRLRQWCDSSLPCPYNIEGQCQPAFVCSRHTFALAPPVLSPTIAETLVFTL